MKKRTLYFFSLGLVLAVVLLACNASIPGGPSNTQQATETKEFVPQGLPVPTKNNVFLPQIRSGSSGTVTPEQAGPPQAIDEPRVDLSASADTLSVGQTVTLLAKPVGIGLPYYYLNARDEGVQNADPMVQVNYDNQITPGNGSSKVVDLVSAVGDMKQAEFVLRAKAPGLTTLTVTATGEIHLNQEGSPAVWSGAGSGSVVITVKP
ncbi:MAG: hypothetical protein P8Z00_17455 [Anaerolineales bacterium]